MNTLSASPAVTANPAALATTPNSIEAIEAEIARLSKLAAGLRDAERNEALQHARSLVAQFAFTASELGIVETAVKSRASARNSAATSTSAPRPKIPGAPSIYGKRTAIAALVVRSLRDDGPQPTGALAARVNAAHLPIPSGVTAGVEISKILGYKKDVFQRDDAGRWSLRSDALQSAYVARVLAMPE